MNQNSLHLSIAVISDILLDSEESEKPCKLILFRIGMIDAKRVMKSLFIVLSVACFVNIQALTPQKGNLYQEEFKNLKEKRFYNIILDRRSPSGPRNLVKNIENAKELGLFARLLRGALVQNSVVVTGKSMPALYAYVRDVCKQFDMRIPTILITKNKENWFFGGSTIKSNSIKHLMSSGAILIGQDLLLESSPKALEAALAHELCHIKYNHDNKALLIEYALPTVVGMFLPVNAAVDMIRNQILTHVVTRLLLAKRFEKQADRFVYETMNNAEGLIELCRYMQKKEQKVDADYNDAYACLKGANISFLDYILNGIGYLTSRTDHRLHKVYKFIQRKTPVGSAQDYQTRINAAQKYMTSKNK